MDANNTVKISARVPLRWREDLRATLIQGGVTVQDFLEACVGVAIGVRKDDPLGAVGILRDQEKKDSFRRVARSMMGVDS